MASFIDSWNNLKAKGYKHEDGSEVLSDLDKESIIAGIKERIELGTDPLEAARLAVQSHMAEAEAQLNEIYKQVGIEVTPDAKEHQSTQDLRSDSALGEE